MQGMQGMQGMPGMGGMGMPGMGMPGMQMPGMGGMPQAGGGLQDKQGSIFYKTRMCNKYVHPRQFVDFPIAIVGLS